MQPQNLSDATIHEYLSFLKKKLPAKATKYNYPFLRKLRIKEKQYLAMTDEALQKTLQNLSDEICDFLMLKKTIKVLLNNTAQAGSFHQTDNLYCIFINKNRVTQPFRQKLGILAHEITHYYLTHHGVRKEVEIENEYLTELGAVFIGLGFFLYEGYEAHVQTHEGYDTRSHTTYTIGYILPNTIKRAIYETAYLRKQHPYYVIQSFPTVLERVIARFKLHGLVKDYKQHLANNNKSISFKEKAKYYLS